VANYRQDPVLRSVVKAVEGLLGKRDSLLVGTLYSYGFLSPESGGELEARPIAYLERVIRLQFSRPADLAYFADARAQSGSHALAHVYKRWTKGSRPLSSKPDLSAKELRATNSGELKRLHHVFLSRPEVSR